MDVIEGLVSLERAKKEYGFTFDLETLEAGYDRTTEFKIVSK